MISAGKATLHECSTIYGIMDVYMMLEVIVIDNYNRYMMSKNDSTG